VRIASKFRSILSSVALFHQRTERTRRYALPASFLLATGLAGLPVVQIAQAAPVAFESIYAFGNSFVETGNHFLLTGGAIPQPPYFDGRFSDGPLWIDDLADRAGLTMKPSEAGFDPATDRAVSFAYGGAGTGLGNPSPAGVPVPGLLSQVAIFRDALDAAGRPADPDALYVVWGGSNDYLLNVTSGPAETVGNIRTAVEQLFDAGARRFLVPNLPDLGGTPAVVEAGLSELFTGLTLGHNQLLAAALSDLESALPDAEVIPLDVFALFEQILADPAAFGFSTDLGAGPAAGCIFPPFACTPGVGGTEMVFWDEVHPSAGVHRLIAAEALGAVRVPEPATAFLIGAGLLGIGLAARRQNGTDALMA